MKVFGFVFVAVFAFASSAGFTPAVGFLFAGAVAYGAASSVFAMRPQAVMG